MTDHIELSPPPSWEYESAAPWFVVHRTVDGKGKAVVLWEWDSAIIHYWRWGKPDDVTGRAIIDGRGATIFGYSSSPDACPSLVGTREAFNATLRIFEDVPETCLDVMMWMPRLEAGRGAIT